jgi:hypothetical protein
LNTTGKAPRPCQAVLQRAVIASPAEFLRASAADSGDLASTGRGSSGLFLQTVVSRARPLGRHARRFRLSGSCSEMLSERETAFRVCSFVSRSAPGLASEPTLRATVAGGDRRFGRRWRGAEPLLTSSNAVGLQRNRSGPAVACEGAPSRTEIRTGRTTPCLQRTLELFSPAVACDRGRLRETVRLATGAAEALQRSASPCGSRFCVLPVAMSCYLSPQEESRWTT